MGRQLAYMIERVERVDQPSTAGADSNTKLIRGTTSLKVVIRCRVFMVKTTSWVAGNTSSIRQLFVIFVHPD